MLTHCMHNSCLLLHVLFSRAGSAALQPSVCFCLQAGAYRTVLTHFSQRYPKIPKIDDSLSSSTCIAFDLMSVNLAGGALHASEAAWASPACVAQLSAKSLLHCCCVTWVA